MAIEFACPNGHKLSSPPDHAGRLAKCPRCGAVTRVPEAGAAGTAVAAPDPLAVPSGSGKLSTAKPPDPLSAAPDAPGPTGDWPGSLEPSDSKKLKSATVSSTPGAAAGNGAPPGASDSIVFLCPNGHKLNAPRSQQGHAGKCPECGVKLRIPMVDDPAALGGLELGDLSSLEDLLEPAAAGSGRSLDTLGLTEPSPAKSASDDMEFWDPDQHPLARLVSRLWAEREHGGIIELHLAGGALLVPEWFERRLSQNTHGLFASQAADGTVTMTIVPWETVTRVVVRGVVGLPDGMFE